MTTVPTPTFTDTDGDGKSNGLGDKVKVAISCTFGVITPGIANILGGSVAVTADSNFPVKSGLTSFAGGGGGSGTAPTAAFLGNGVIAPSSISGVAPFVVDFRDSSGGSPTAWAWDFKDGSTSTAQDPGFHTFTNPGTYVVSMTASNFLGYELADDGRHGRRLDDGRFHRRQDDRDRAAGRHLHEHLDRRWHVVSPGHSVSGQGTGTGATASKTYSTPGTYTVTLTVTYPAPTGAVVASKTGYISVGVGNCTVPTLNGVKRNSAQGVWSGASFTGTVSDGPGAPERQLHDHGPVDHGQLARSVQQQRGGEPTMNFLIARRRRRRFRSARSRPGPGRIRPGPSDLPAHPVALFDLGRAVFAWNTLTNAAREGARIAIVNQDAAKHHRIGPRARRGSWSSMLPNVTVNFYQSTTNGTADTSRTCSPVAVGCLAVVGFEATYRPITPIIANILFKNGVTFKSTLGPVRRIQLPEPGADGGAVSRSSHDRSTAPTAPIPRTP